jgi:hypothetical protein
MSLVAPDYIQGHGHITFAREVDLTARSSPRRRSRRTSSARPRAKYLTNDVGRLSIPFRLTGVLPNMPKPDGEFLGRVLQRALAGEGLDRLLGGDGSGEKRKQTEDAIKKALDKLFHH